MIKQTANNRKVIKDYLESLSEDDFIDKIIVPIFSRNGYILYRKNVHGPGEHGKDAMFYRHVQLYYGVEYVAVQAKAEQVHAGNVAKFADQLTRAFKVPFPGKTGLNSIHPNYVMFMNSKTHTNDADFEFQHLIEGNCNIKILSQENIIELVISNDFVPDDIKHLIEKYEVDNTDFETEIRDIIYSNNINSIKFLFNTQLKIA